MDEDEIIVRSTSYMEMLWASIACSGWYILAVAAAIFFVSPYLEEKYATWKQSRDEAEYSAKYHKNPDFFEQRMREVEHARERMQEQYNASVNVALAKAEETKEAKQQELLKMIDKQTTNRRLGTTNDSVSASKLHNDYNPLMGHSSRGYRAPKRSCCRKGGCG